MNNLIHYYGKWAECPIPTNCGAIYLKWDDSEQERLSAIIFNQRDEPTIYDLIKYAIAQENEQPVGVSYDYKLL